MISDFRVRHYKVDNSALTWTVTLAEPIDAFKTILLIDLSVIKGVQVLDRTVPGALNQPAYGAVFTFVDDGGGTWPTVTKIQIRKTSTAPITDSRATFTTIEFVGIPESPNAFATREPIEKFIGTAASGQILFGVDGPAPLGATAQNTIYLDSGHISNWNVAGVSGQISVLQRLFSGSVADGCSFNRFIGIGGYTQSIQAVSFTGSNWGVRFVDSHTMVGNQEGVPYTGGPVVDWDHAFAISNASSNPWQFNIKQYMVRTWLPPFNPENVPMAVDPSASFAARPVVSVYVIENPDIRTGNAGTESISMSGGFPELVATGTADLDFDRAFMFGSNENAELVNANALSNSVWSYELDNTVWNPPNDFWVWWRGSANNPIQLASMWYVEVGPFVDKLAPFDGEAFLAALATIETLPLGHLIGVIEAMATLGGSIQAEPSLIGLIDGGPSAKTPATIYATEPIAGGAVLEGEVESGSTIKAPRGVRVNRGPDLSG